MKKLFFFLLVSILSGAASAQPGADGGLAADDRERQRIQDERAALEVKFDAEEAACYQKFAVNYCLNRIKPLRREAMAELRRQEVELDEAKRKQKAAEQILKTEEKSSPEAQQQAAERRAASLEEARVREERSRQKTDERINLKQNEAQNAADTAKRLKGSQEKSQARIDKQGAVAEEVKKYKEKQQEVLERKANRDKKKREQTKPAAKPLPAPG
jgi:colicin import membrane protein